MPVDLLTWSALGVLALSLVYGFGSALLPLLNAEAYVIAAQASPRTAGVAVAVTLAIGQSAGKVVLFLASRKGRSVAVLQRRRRRVGSSNPSHRGRVERVVRGLLNLVGSRRWGVPIVLLSAVVGVPPIYAVALVAGASRMRICWFAPAVLVGRTARFVLLSTGVGSGLHHVLDH